jgi:outer membrane protein assembly factor BamB
VGGSGGTGQAAGGSGGLGNAGGAGMGGGGAGGGGAGGGPHSHYDWLQFCGDSQHSCINTLETTLNAGNVQGLKKLFSVPLTNASDGQPVFLSGVAGPMGVRDMLYVLTSQGKIVAMDAYTGATVWSKTYGGTSYLVTSPAIDPDRQFVYTYGLDGKVHKLKVEDGTEILTGGWPELSTAINGMRGYSLSIATAKDGNKYLYSNVTGYGASPGSITIIHLINGSQHVFNGTCSFYDGHFGLPGAPACADAGGNSWSRAGVVYHPDLDRVFMSTGNDGGKGLNLTLLDWTGSVLALRPDGTTNQGMPLDSYTSSTFTKECFSVAPALIPTLPGCKYKYLGLQGHKGSRLRFINMEDLSGQGGPGHLAPDIGMLYTVPQGGVIYAHPVVWTNPADKSVWAFVGTENGLCALQFGVDANGLPTMNFKWTHATSFTTTPTIANGVLYATDGGGQARFWAGDDHGIHKIYALNPLTGAELWSAPIDFHHWSSPVVVNGVLYIADGKTGEAGASQANAGTMTAFSLGGVPIATARAMAARAP